MKVDLTEEEFELISKRREKAEKIKKKRAPIKTGELKHNLYSLHIQYEDLINDEWLFNEEEKSEIIKNLFVPFLDKGTKFECHLRDNLEYWFDSINVGCENMDSDWANENLINIKEVK